MNAKTYTPSTEQQRAAEQDANNTSRFFNFNNRRIAAGLSMLSYVDFLGRKIKANHPLTAH